MLCSHLRPRARDLANTVITALQAFQNGSFTCDSWMISSTFYISLIDHGRAAPCCSPVGIRALRFDAAPGVVWLRAVGSSSISGAAALLLLRHPSSRHSAGTSASVANT